MADRIGTVKYLETSAMTGDGIDQLFMTIAEDEDVPLLKPSKLPELKKEEQCEC